MGRCVERFGSQADETALEKLIEKVEESTARANRALDYGLAALAAGMARIDRMEKRAARGRSTKAERLAKHAVAMNEQMEDMTGRVIRLETALEIGIAGRRRRPAAEKRRGA